MQFLHVTSPGSSAIVTSPRPHRVRLLPLRLRAWMVRGGSPQLALAASVARCSPCIGSVLQCSQGVVHGAGKLGVSIGGAGAVDVEQDTAAVTVVSVEPPPRSAPRRRRTTRLPPRCSCREPC